MTPEVRAWVADRVAELAPRPPTLEVGSRDINGNVRDLFPGEYVGLDKEAGPNVDLVGDLFAVCFNRTFRTIVCLETLEHITEPWRALELMCSWLSPGGLFLGSWPFIFEVHDYPIDYWRVTPAGFEYILRRAGFAEVNVERMNTHSMAVARK